MKGSRVLKLMNHSDYLFQNDLVLNLIHVNIQIEMGQSKTTIFPNLFLHFFTKNKTPWQ